jgi:putative YhbY family RNA-binding protein
MNPLSPKKRSELRSEAHKLSPLVIIGDKGLTDLVVAEIDRTLKAHELIKVRANTDDRKARDQWLADICARLEAHAVQQIGKVFVIYREDPEARKEARKPAATRLPPKPNARGKGKPRPVAEPPRFRRTKDAAKEAADEVKRTSRRQSRTPEPRPESEPRRRPRSTSR